jgi:hypothetical protein
VRIKVNYFIAIGMAFLSTSRDARHENRLMLRREQKYAGKQLFQSVE